jgi:hypothetical protein
MIWELLVGMILAGNEAHAHHSFAAEFDAKAPVSLRGKVTKVRLVNPHSWIYLHEGKTGKDWMVEAGTPNTLLRAGVTQDTLKAGTGIVVKGFQSKDHRCTPECKANGQSMTLPTGEKLFLGSSAP